MNRWAAGASAALAVAGSLAVAGLVVSSRPAAANPSGASPQVFLAGPGATANGPYEELNLSSLRSGGASPASTGSLGAPVASVAVNSTARKVVYGLSAPPNAAASFPAVRVEDVASRTVNPRTVVTGDPIAIAADPTNPSRAYVLEYNRSSGGPARVDVLDISTSPPSISSGFTPSARVGVPAAIAISPDGSTLFIAGEASVNGGADLEAVPVSNPANFRLFSFGGHTGSIVDVAVAPAGNALYGISSDGGLFALKLPYTGSPTLLWSPQQLPTAGSALSTPTAITVSPDGSTLYLVGTGFNVAGASTSAAQAFSSGSGNPAATQTLPISPGDGNDGAVSEAVSPDGQTLLVAGTDSGTGQATVVSLSLPGMAPVRTSSLGTNFGSLAGPEQLAITPDQAPVAAFNESAGAAGSPSGFDAGGSTVAYGSVTTFAWNFGDGHSQTTSGSTVSHTYASAGNYTVTLVETDAAGTSVPPSVGGTFFSVNGPGQTPFKRADPSAATSHQIAIPPPGSTPTTAPQRTPTLVLNPGLGPPGALVTVTGSGFPANTPITVGWSVSSGSVVIVSDASGNLPATILPVLVPDVLGPRFAVASSTPAAQAPFLVVPGSAEPGGHEGSYLFRTEGP